MRPAPNPPVAVEPLAPGRLALESGRPNPFVALTSLRFVLAHAGQVDLRIVDVRGRLVHRLESSSLAAGTYARSWDGTDLTGRIAPAGVYFAELVTDEGTASTRLVRMR